MVKDNNINVAQIVQISTKRHEVGHRVKFVSKQLVAMPGGCAAILIITIG